MNVPHHLEHIQALLKGLRWQPKDYAISGKHFTIETITKQGKGNQTYQAPCQVVDVTQLGAASPHRSSS